MLHLVARSFLALSVAHAAVEQSVSGSHTLAAAGVGLVSLLLIVKNAGGSKTTTFVRAAIALLPLLCIVARYISAVPIDDATATAAQHAWTGEVDEHHAVHDHDGS